MSVYRRGGVYWMHFQYRGQHFQETTGQQSREAALAVERKRKDQVRQIAHGVAIPEQRPTASFMAWANSYYEHVEPQLTRPEIKKYLIGAALRFWGRQIDKAERSSADAPYHDLALGDVVTNPHWIVQWEAWLEHRGLSPQTKNHYRSLMHDMFRVATSPAWRQLTGVVTNPFAGQWRDPVEGRTVALERDDLLTIIRHAAPHLKRAIAIAVLAPKLRLSNILKLTWKGHLSKDYSLITIRDHKTRRKLKRPLVVYTSAQLRQILKDARKRSPRSTHVITYHGQPIKQIRGAVLGAVTRAIETDAPHLVYGRAHVDGITFHALRHTAATMLAELEVAPEKRQALMGHRDLATTMRYTHLRPKHELAPAEQLSAALPELADLVASGIISEDDARHSRELVVAKTVTGRKSGARKTRVKARIPVTAGRGSKAGARATQSAG